MKFFQYYDENHAVRLGFCRGELLADAQASVQKSGAEIPTMRIEKRSWKRIRPSSRLPFPVRFPLHRRSPRRKRSSALA